jgi:pimeloyl-ACP methyl ester carboxylesterase
MEEAVVQFGSDDRLLGIVTAPDELLPDAPACLLLNSGVVHRIGPHRLNVKIARAMAEHGITSMRVDLSGLGDSPAAPGAAHFGEQSVRDLQAAMDHLESTQGIRRFIVFGLCSGAVNGYRLALEDKRVVGLLMFDGFVYPTLKTHLLRRWERFRSLPWSSLARKIPQRLSRLLRPGASKSVSDDAHLSIPSRQQFAQAMDNLIERGVAVYLVYSGSFLEGHNYHRQLRDAFGGARFLAHVRYDFMPDVDHTATPLAAQRKVIAAVGGWVQSVAGSSGSSTKESLSLP